MNCLLAEIITELCECTNTSLSVKDKKQYVVSKLINSKHVTVDSATEIGHLDAVKHLIEVEGKECTERAMYKAVVNGQLEIVKYFRTLGKDFTIALNFSDFHAENAIDCASRNGYCELVKYLHETVGAKCTTDAMDGASERGYLETVKYLHETVGAK